MLPKHSPDEDAQKLVQNLELSPTEEISIKNDYQLDGRLLKTQGTDQKI